MKNNNTRSPLFYVGDKYKILPQIKAHFPEKIENFYEPFVGGGSVFLNTKAKKYFINDIDKNVISIHQLLIDYSLKNKEASFFNKVKKIITKYSLSRSFIEDVIPTKIKDSFKKTYIAEFNRVNYLKLREDFNKKKKRDYFVLYILLIYGFNRMLRFNKSNEFNVPVGNVDFNKNVKEALTSYFEKVKNRKIETSSLDFEIFIKNQKIKSNDFVYIDPPYLITFSEYNKIWNEKDEKLLLETLDELNKNGIKFALSNVTHYKGKKNNILIKWMKKYKSYEIKSNYISYHNNSAKIITEVLIKNYD